MIVDDGSTDRTAAIVEEYCERHRVDRSGPPAAAGRAELRGQGPRRQPALERIRATGCSSTWSATSTPTCRSKPITWNFCWQSSREDPKLGVAGTPFTQEGGYDSTRDSFEGQNYVAGPCQLFRDECFRDIGGYVANHAGGVDWIAVMTARMKGWTVTAFPEKRFHHHRPMGTAERGRVGRCFPTARRTTTWAVRRCGKWSGPGYQTTKRPLIVGGLSLFAGYAWATLSRMPRAVSPELMRFHRAEQMRKLRAVLGSLCAVQES